MSANLKDFEDLRTDIRACWGFDLGKSLVRQDEASGWLWAESQGPGRLGYLVITHKNDPEKSRDPIPWEATLTDRDDRWWKVDVPTRDALYFTLGRWVELLAPRSATQPRK